MDKKPEFKVVCQNRKAKYDYHVMETIECGIVLNGPEIKSIRDNAISIDASYARIQDGEVWLIDCNIEPYKNTKMFLPDPKRERKLLLQRRQIKQLAAQVQQRGITLIPLAVILKNNLCKIQLGVCQGKKQHDKRQSIKERETRREMERND